MLGASVSAPSMDSARAANSTVPPAASRSAARSLTTSVCAYTITDRPPVRDGKSIRCERRSKRSSMPSCRRPWRSIRSPAPEVRRMSTVSCSRMPARWRCSTYSRVRSSSTTLSMPCRCSRWESSRPAGPAPMMPTLVRMAYSWSGGSVAGIDIGEDALCGGEGRVGRGDSAVDGRLQEHFLDVVGGEAVAQRGPDVHGQFVQVAVGDQGGQGDAAAGAPVESGAGPDLAPCVAGDEVLEFGGEGGGALDRLVHVRVAEHLSAYGHPGGVPRVVVGGALWAE